VVKSKCIFSSNAFKRFDIFHVGMMLLFLKFLVVGFRVKRFEKEITVVAVGCFF
jgi:hypothetical protein